MLIAVEAGRVLRGGILGASGKNEALSIRFAPRRVRTWPNLQAITIKFTASPSVQRFAQCGTMIMISVACAGLTFHSATRSVTFTAFSSHLQQRQGAVGARLGLLRGRLRRSLLALGARTAVRGAHRRPETPQAQLSKWLLKKERRTSVQEGKLMIHRMVPK